MQSKSHHGGNRTPGPTLEVFEGNHETTGVTGLLLYSGFDFCFCPLDISLFFVYTAVFILFQYCT